MNNIVLCADDYALNGAVDDAVIELASAGILQATSCMTNSPRWPAAAQRLKTLQVPFQVGLHFNLTEGFGQDASRLEALIIKAYLRLLSPEKIRKALVDQLDAFVEHFGRLPDFIDGHQHVHQLPVIRDVLLEIVDLRITSCGMPAPWIRNTVPANDRLGRKAQVLSWLGGRRLREQLRARGIPSNKGFAGVYGFDAGSPDAYGQLMQQWCRNAEAGLLIMCHPANQLEQQDVIAGARVIEYTWLRAQRSALSS